MSSKNATKIQVQFDVPGRSVYDLSHSVRFDTQVGAITPITHFDCLPRDRFDIKLSSLIKTFPAKAPIMGRFKARIYAFFAPDRLYVPELRPNGLLMRQADPNSTSIQTGALYPVLPFYAIGTGMTPSATGPFEEDDNTKPWNLVVGKGSLLEHCGFAQGFWNREGSDVDNYRIYSALRPMMYYDVFRNYFANPQEPTFPIYGGSNSERPSMNKVGFRLMSFSSLQSYYENLVYQRGATYREGYIPDELERCAIFNPMLSKDWDTYLDGVVPIGFDYQSPFGQFFAPINASSMGGLCLKTYTPDINSVFVSDALYKAAIARSIVNTANGLNMQDLLAGEKLFNYFTKMAATGARFDEFVRAEWGVNITNRLDIPVYLKSWSFDIGFDDVVSQSQTSEGVLGQLGGRGLGGMTDNDTFTFTPDEYGTLAFYMTIEPYPDYYQGNDPMLSKTQFIDRFTPSMDRMGFQPLAIEQLNAVSVVGGTEVPGEDGSPSAYGTNAPWNVDIDNSVGQQPAWQEYKGMVSRVRGDVADELRYWTLARPINPQKYTTYIQPSQFMYAFDDTSADSRPFIVQVGFNVYAKRGISHRSLETF